MIRVICILLNLFVLQEIQAQDADVMLSQTEKKFFIENKGQWPSDVLYLTRIGGLDAWITKQGVVYDFYKMKEKPETGNIDLERMHKHHDKFEHREYERYGQVVKVNNINANSYTVPEGREKQIAYYNYFIGNDSTKWANYVGLYKEVFIKNIYNGISRRWYFAKGGLRYDYIVEPGADYSQIQINIEGAENCCIKDNELLFTTRFGEVKQAELLVYQNLCGKKIPINAKWLKQENIISFEISHYDKSLPLIIDPLIYSTFIGSISDDIGYSLALDNSGKAYITGMTYSTNYPITSGAYDQSFNGTSDVFVTKLNAQGSILIYSTFIGGNDWDSGYSLAIDNSGNAYITGATISTDYPITSGAYDQSFNGNIDIFVTKLNTVGSTLLYSTFIGGNSGDIGYSLVLDNSGNAYITGRTASTDYPTTAGAYYQFFNGNSDVFVTKLNVDSSALLYSTFIGGNDIDIGNSIALDNSGNAYITGNTESTNYPNTAGAYNQSSNGGNDVFVTKLSIDGSALLYSTFIGGNFNDYAYSLALDYSGNAYITGRTFSTDYPTTAGSYDQSFNGSWDVFVTKLNITGSALHYSSFIGGNNYEEGLSLTVDNSCNAYITGRTASTDYPTTANAYDQSFNSFNYQSDVFVTKLNVDGSALLYSTFIGGNDEDECYSLALDNFGNAYITGDTRSTNYPTTPGAAHDLFFNGNSDVFITKLFLGTTDIIDFGFVNNNITIYPNPNSGTFVIKTVQPAVFELIDVTGRVIKTFNVNNRNFTVNERLSEGIYFIKELNSSRTIKLIIEETSN